MEFDEGNRNDKARTLRIRTPHRFEDGEVMYAYIDIDNVANRRVRVSDDGVTTDWLRHQDAFWTLCQERQHVSKVLLPQLGLKYVSLEGMSLAEHIENAGDDGPILQISKVCDLEEVPAMIDRVCGGMRTVADHVRRLKYGENARFNAVDRKAGYRATPYAGGLKVAA